MPRGKQKNCLEDYMANREATAEKAEILGLYSVLTTVATRTKFERNGPFLPA